MKFHIISILFCLTCTLLAENEVKQDNINISKSIVIKNNQENRSILKESKDLHHRFKLGFSFIPSQTRDDVLNELVWNGAGLGFEMGYNYSSLNGLHMAELNFPISFIANKYWHLGVTTALGLSYGYLYKTFKQTNFGSLYLGGIIDSDKRISYFADWDDAHIYWLTDYGLGPYLLWKYKYKNKREFELEFDTPIIAFVSRPPLHRYYKIGQLTHIDYLFREPDQNLKFTNILKFQSIDLKFTYIFPINRTKFIPSYKLQFVTYGQSERITILSHSFILSFKWDF